MAKINLNEQTAQELDIAKRVLEAQVIVRLNSIFRNMANDASNLYRATGNVPSRELANNYAPEFLKEIRDAMRKSIKKFGFNLRKVTEKKHNIFFDAENKVQFLDLNIKQAVTIQDDNLDEKVNSINNQFLIASTLFIANESENQNNYIEETNSKMLENSVIIGLTLFADQLARRQEEISELSNQLITATPAEQPKITRRIAVVNRQINELNNNERTIIAKNIKDDLVKRIPARSELIAETNVGLAESWSRQEEAKLIDEANLSNENEEELVTVKTWRSILDSRTRTGIFNHVTPDGQVRAVNDAFAVSGERLMTPRDTSLGASIGNVARCRCEAMYDVVTREESLRILE